MIKPLVVVFVVVELLDFATYSVIPWAESNPVMANLPVIGVAAFKAAGVLVTLLACRVRPRIAATVLSVGIAIGAFGFGTNTAAISMLMKL